ncbi:MAG: hypothetical protein ABW298_14470 [Candidatus Binatia bacterium]
MDVGEANQLIDMLGRQTKRELSNRGKLETILFPNTAYENLSAIEIFYRYPEIVGAIARVVSPEELGRLCPKIGGPVIPMQFWTIGFEYLWGRQILLGLGKLQPGDRTAETLAVLDFWKRINGVYRGDTALCNGEAGGTSRVLSPDEAQRVAAETKSLGDEDRASFLRLHAQLLSFLILMNCESRAKYGVTGPYELGEKRVMIVAEFADLPGRSYPWGIPDSVPVSHVTVAVVLEDVKIRLANAGLPYGKPPNFLEKAVSARVYTSDGKTLSPLEAEEWEPTRKAIAQAQRELYRRIARLSARDRILAGASVYFWFIRPLADVAGVSAGIDWNLLHAPEFLDVFADSGRADRIFEECLILPREEASSYTPLPTAA